MSGPVHITLAVPTPFAVDPVRLVAWLVERGYQKLDIPRDPLWAHYERGAHGVAVPLHEEYSDFPRCLLGAIREAAKGAGIEPAALAALLAPPVEGPALQWAHMADAAQERILALLDGPAREHRAAAVLARMADDTASALAHEGAALGLEAAAAVLRGGGR